MESQAPEAESALTNEALDTWNVEGDVLLERIQRLQVRLGRSASFEAVDLGI